MIAKAYRALVKPLFLQIARDVISRVVSAAPGSPPPHRFTFADAPANAERSPYPFMVDSQHDVLSQLCAKYLPSKRNHNYLPYYWLHFRDVRHSVRHMLEIAVQTDHSIRMWEEFFPAATIYGIDIEPNCKQFEGGRRRVFIGDQGDTAFLQLVADQIEAPLDIIIDDGSHGVLHQLATFETLFPRMSDHGTYVIARCDQFIGEVLFLSRATKNRDAVHRRAAGFCLPDTVDPRGPKGK